MGSEIKNSLPEDEDDDIERAPGNDLEPISEKDSIAQDRSALII